jgi:hypothetical protein
MKVVCDNKTECIHVNDCLHAKEHLFIKGDCDDECGSSCEAKCKQVGPMIIYLAGPMSNNEHASYENYNFDEFDRVRDELKILGHHPISPADIDRLFEGWDKYPPADFDPTREDVARFMRRDQNAIEGADAIYMMEGWEHSKGARDEFAHAEFLGKKIMYEIERIQP